MGRKCFIIIFPFVRNRGDVTTIFASDVFVLDGVRSAIDIYIDFELSSERMELVGTMGSENFPKI